RWSFANGSTETFHICSCNGDEEPVTDEQTRDWRMSADALGARQMTTSLVLSFLFSSTAAAAEPDWQPVVTDLLKSEKTGFGGLCGVVVDHGTGDVWVNLSDRGMFHSRDQCKTWKRASAMQPKGRTETPGCWLLDPTGKSERMVTALVY